MQIVRARDRRSRLRAVLVLGLLGVPFASTGASAQMSERSGGSASSGTATRPDAEVVKPEGGMSRGVIVPKAGVDPGMKVKAPRMPVQSMPVIRPQPAAPGGSAVVVPR
jgi:hypothetical protein